MCRLAKGGGRAHATHALHGLKPGSDRPLRHPAKRFRGRPALVGFSLAFVGYQDQVRYLHSNVTAVLPEFQDKGVGKLLKLAQRQDGIARGFDHMEWTFDPLQIRNAQFSIIRLGGSYAINSCLYFWTDGWCRMSKPATQEYISLPMHQTAVQHCNHFDNFHVSDLQKRRGGSRRDSFFSVTLMIPHRSGLHRRQFGLRPGPRSPWDQAVECGALVVRRSLLHQ